MNATETIAALLGTANVALVARRSVWNYPFALAMVSLFGVIFFKEKLYSDALLQLFFFVINIYGWIVWHRAEGEAGEVVTRSMPARLRFGWLAITLVAAVIWSGAMAHYTDAALPWIDGPIAMTSIVAQILLSRRYWENWILWIVVDIASIGMYWVKDLHVTAALYTLFLGLSVWGLVGWRRSMAK
ncbi:nicotinamide riboside transporter PnuC [Sphingomonas montanisoli]|uniref:Nicotinamide riboside transporter PnuC n=1 Tax=Sphingomonas montanisoli TaxID=2606412 RepID=A0A5D9CE13_9SPHN|nr:nicotinamide riboside transporter PnuC [Sphingomonas montanisoli]TZG29596.1 nicotinamide mononucleotide transporter [Sphingomonas montanisoli]